MAIYLGKTKPEDVGSWQDFSSSTSTDRVKKLRAEALKDVEICLEYPRCQIEAYEKSVHEPRVIQRARVFENYLQKKTIRIFDGELIIGNVTSKYRASKINPELDGEWMYRELQEPGRSWMDRPQDPHLTTKEEYEELVNTILPYWQGKTFDVYCAGRMPDEIRRKGFANGDSPYIPMITKNMDEKEIGHLMPDIEKILKVGFTGIKAEVEAELAKLDPKSGDPKVHDKIDFYNACLISLNAAIAYGDRCAETAREMAAKEQDPVRRKELEKIAEVVARVPAYPARDWWEAIQCVYSIMTLIYCEEINNTNCLGRWDQYLYPYYRKTVLEDKEMTHEEARELFELLLIKLSVITVMFSCDVARLNAGYSTSMAATIGGIKGDGSDACNEVTMLILEAEENVHLIAPDLGMFIWEGTPQEYVRKAAEVIRLGTGKPKMFSTKSGLAYVKEHYPGFTVEELQEKMGVVGCAEPVIPGYGQDNGFGSLMAMGAILEIAMNNGRTPRDGSQIGPKTGEVKEFTSIDDLKKAFKEQLRYFTYNSCLALKTQFECEGERNQLPFCSTLINGPIEKGRDVSQNGAAYTFWGILYCGFTDVGDSLHIIDQLIFKEKKITWDQMLDALAHNWEGYEDLRQMCINGVTKWGNDIPEADEYVKWVNRTCIDVTDWINQQPECITYWGPGRWTCQHTAVTLHISTGELTGALPNGHYAFTPTGDTSSAIQGMDRNGPTAVVKSVSCIDYSRCRASVNVKFPPQFLMTDKDMEDFTAFLRTVDDLGIFHMQINVVSDKLLRDAQIHPEKHRDILIRVASYEAYFVELDKITQDEIISRTQNTRW